MKISCPSCRAAFALDDKRVPPAGLSIKCPKCKSPFTVHRPKPGEEGKTVEGRPTAVPLPAPRHPPEPLVGTMVDARPVAPAPAGDLGGTMLDARPPGAVPLPGRSPPPETTVMDYRPAVVAPPEPENAPEAEDPFAAPPAEPPHDHVGDTDAELGQPAPPQDDGAVPLPGGQPREAAPPPEQDQAFEVGYAEPAASPAPPSPPGEDEAVPLPGGQGHQPQHDQALQEEPQEAPPPVIPPPPPLPDAPEPQAFSEDAVPLPGGEHDEVVHPKGEENDPFANIDLGSDTMQDQAPLSISPAAPPPPADDFAFADAPPADAQPPARPPPEDDPFGLDQPPAPQPPPPPAPSAPPPSGGAKASNEDGGINFDFLDDQAVVPKGNAPPAEAAKTAGELLDFVDEPQLPKPAPRPARAPPKMERAKQDEKGDKGAAGSFDDFNDLGDAKLEAPPPGEEAGKKKKKPKKERPPGEPLGEKLKKALGNVPGGLSALREKPRVLGGIAGGLVLLAFVAAGIRAGRTSSGYFWRNKLTSSGKANTAAASAALKKGQEKLAEGTFAATREAQGVAAQTLQVLPDDEEARAFFVLCASELKAGYGQTGADWDQAKRVVEKLKGSGLVQLRARGAFALASGDLAKARTMLGSIGDTPSADLESVYVYAQTLLKAGEAAHAAQVLDNSLKTAQPPKLLVQRGMVARARGQIPEAAQWFEKALEKNPMQGRALVELADVRLRQNDLPGAQAILERALNPEVRKQLDATEEGRASMFRARLLAEQHQGKEAEAQFDRATKLDENSAEIAGAFGAFRLKRREYEKAAFWFDKALKLESSPEVLGLAARAYLGVNRYVDADKRIREALQKDPQNARLVFISGKVAESIGKTEEAAHEYERALTKKPDLAEALIAQGLIALAAGDKDKAKDRLELAVKSPVESKSAQDLEGIGELWLQLGDAVKAKEAFAAAQALDPEDPYGHSGMGRALMALDDGNGDANLKAARPELEAALARVDTDPAIFYEYGSLLRRLGDLDGAKAPLLKATQLSGKDARYLARLGAVLVEKGEYNDAVNQLRQAVLMNDRHPEALFFLGRALAGQKKLGEAVETLRKAVEVEPGNALFLYHLGLVYEQGAQVGDAVDAFSKSVAQDGKNADSLEHLGLNLIVQNRFSEAIDAFKKALQVDPDRARLWAQVGEAMAAAGDVDGAIANFQRSVKQDANQPEVWTRLGVAYKDKACDTCKGKAIEALQRAVKLDARDAQAWYQLGYIYKDDRRRTDAVIAFRKYLELKPAAADAETVKDDIYYLQEEGKRAP